MAEYKTPIKYGHPIDALLDACMSQLQHDTGEYDPEWHHDRHVLAEKFRKILRRKAKRP